MSRQQFAMDDYVDVNTRVAEFREKYPEGSLQQVALEFREVNGGWWVIYTAGAYRTPDDARPGHGTAWEPIPGRTPYTKDSEVQNAETAAWGRAIVAALAADTKRGIASREEVRNAVDRREAAARPQQPAPTVTELLTAAQAAANPAMLDRIASAAKEHLSEADLGAVRDVVIARRAELAERAHHAETGGTQ